MERWEYEAKVLCDIWDDHQEVHLYRGTLIAPELPEGAVFDKQEAYKVLYKHFQEADIGYLLDWKLHFIGDVEPGVLDRNYVGTL